MFLFNLQAYRYPNNKVIPDSFLTVSFWTIIYMHDCLCPASLCIYFMMLQMFVLYNCKITKFQKKTNNNTSQNYSNIFTQIHILDQYASHIVHVFREYNISSLSSSNQPVRISLKITINIMQQYCTECSELKFVIRLSVMTRQIPRCRKTSRASGPTATRNCNLKGLKYIG